MINHCKPFMSTTLTIHCVFSCVVHPGLWLAADAIFHFLVSFYEWNYNIYAISALPAQELGEMHLSKISSYQVLYSNINSLTSSMSFVMQSKKITSVWNQRCDIFRFLFDWNAHLETCNLLKHPPESDQCFRSYEQLQDSQNNKKQEIHSSFCLYLAINDPNFRLIPLDRNTFVNKSSSRCQWINEMCKALGMSKAIWLWKKYYVQHFNISFNSGPKIVVTMKMWCVT